MTEATLTAAGREIEISHPDKVLFPTDGITKADLAAYYRRVADTMLPHLEDRPLTLQRFPDGIGEEGFFQKEASEYFPDWIERVEVAKEGGTVHHVLCRDAATLVYLADQAMITPHVWLSRADRPQRPDRMIFDLDPPEGGALAEVRFAARAVRDLLAEVGLGSRLMTTGSRGYHVVVPLAREEEFDPVRAFARDLARLLADRHPERLTVEPRKAKRKGRVFLDYLRNGYAQTAVAPYAVRARPGAPVATPLDWDELGRVEPRRYTLENLFQRLGQKDDPWKDIGRKGESLSAARGALGERLKAEKKRT